MSHWMPPWWNVLFFAILGSVNLFVIGGHRGVGWMIAVWILGYLSWAAGYKPWEK